MKSKIIMAALVLSTQAHAEFFSGNKLLDLIKDEKVSANMVAIGYIMGVSDTTNGVLHCTPSEVTAGQIRDMTRAYLDRMPEVRHYTADVVINDMLKRSWPCPDRPKQGRQSL